MSYLVEQGLGQAAIQWKGRDNKKVLADPHIALKDKEKIKKIGEYKKKFEQYFDKKFKYIYEKTTFLDRKAVSYMVTASPLDKISPYQVSFPIVGRFPYLAFFKKKSALKFQKKLQEQGLETWVRPVYAYSSLNYFNDRILSSFFVYNDLELAELVFHELTHLLFFAKNNVGFNESLAQYVSHELLKELLADKGADFVRKKKKARALTRKLVPLVQNLNKRYEKVDQGYLGIRQEFLENHFFKVLKEFCSQKNENSCQYNVENWNNARLVGFLNYEGLYEDISRVHKKMGGSLKEFLAFLKKAHEEKKSSDHFMDYLKIKVGL